MTSRVAFAQNADPLSVPRVRVPGLMPCSVTARWMTAIASWARQRTVRSQPTISRVQQSMICVQVAPAVLSDPDRGHVQVPKLPGPGDLEEPGPAAPELCLAALDQLALAHHAQHPFAVDRTPQLAAGDRTDHPVTIGRVSLGRLHDRLLDLVDRWVLCGVRRPGRAGCPVDRLTGDPHDARHDRGLVAAVH